VAKEQELVWELGTKDDGRPIRYMLRVDALLRERGTESLFYREYKTTAWGDYRWALSFENNAQVMANLRAIEATLGERPLGVQIEGHLKGNRRTDTAKASTYSGTEIQDSILCYAYESGPGNVSLSWKARGVRRGVWELGFTPRRWVEDYLNEQDCRGLFINLPPISPDPYALDRWQRQTVAQEARIARALSELEQIIASPWPDADAMSTRVLDREFPLHETSCIRYNQKCSHYSICHESGVRAAPLAFYGRRIPHHATEAVQQAAEVEQLTATLDNTQQTE
jgi:hypothetical protein